MVTATGILAVSADAAVWEPNQPRLQRIDVPLLRLPEALDGFTIAQLSDFHYDDYFSVWPIRKAVDIVNTLHPDVVVLTGDFVTVPVFVEYLHNAEQALVAAEPCARILGKLRAHLATVAVLGNHDLIAEAEWVTRTLVSQGISVLRNQSLPLQRDGARLWITGLDDVMEGRPDLERSLRGLPPDEPAVVLVHEPDYADRVARYPVDLQLSGHSHGGQIRLPLIGAPFLPQLARKYPWGLRRIGPLTLYTNVGLGTIRIPARLNCPPEVTLFTLRVAASKDPPTSR